MQVHGVKLMYFKHSCPNNTIVMLQLCAIDKYSATFLVITTYNRFCPTSFMSFLSKRRTCNFADRVKVIAQLYLNAVVVISLSYKENLALFQSVLHVYLSFWT